MFGNSGPPGPAWPEWEDRKRLETLGVVFGFVVLSVVAVALLGWRRVWTLCVSSVVGLIQDFRWLGRIGPTITQLRRTPLDGHPLVTVARSTSGASRLAVRHAVPLPPITTSWLLVGWLVVLLMAWTALTIWALYRWPPAPLSVEAEHDRRSGAVVGSRVRAYRGTTLGLGIGLVLIVVCHHWIWPPGWTALGTGTFVRWAAVLVVAVALLGDSVLVSRTYWRLWRRARTVWHEITFYQDDQISPVAYIAVMDNIYQAIQTRSPLYNTAWWYRLWVGQNGWSINILRTPLRDDATRLHVLLAGPDPAIRRVAQALATQYSNLRFHTTAPPTQHSWRYYIRWRLKYRTPLHIIRLVSRDPIIPLNNVVQALSAANTPEDAQPPAVFIQLLLIPVGTQRARTRLQRAVNVARWRQDEVEAEASRQTLSQVGNGRFRTEWRAAADDYELLRRVTGAWAFESKYAEIQAQNVLVMRQRTEAWMRTNLPKPWPLARGPMLWSSECAAVFALPTGELRVDDLVRSMTRRMPAPLALNRALEMAIVEAETNNPDRPWQPVGLHERDRNKNVLIRGIQGAGKSNTEVNLFRSDALAKNSDGTWAKACVLVDIGKDTAAAILQCIPPERTVIYFSPSEDDNPWAMQPLASPVEGATQVSHVLQMLIDTFGEDAIQARSQQILSQAMRAVIDVFGSAASITELQVMLTNDEERDAIIAQVQDEEVKHYWNVQFKEGRESNPSFWEEALAAPRNKLDALLRHGRVKAALDYRTARQQMRQFIDWDEVIREGHVVIMNIDKAALGSEATRLFGIATLLNLWYALQRQQTRPEAERRKVSVVIDEAQNFLSQSFTTIMAEGRGYGLEMTVAVRFLSEIRDPLIQEALINLCQNQVIYRINHVKEADTIMKQAQKLYHNNITLAEDVMSLTNFSADDIMHLEDHHALCMWQAQGKVQPPFNARTIDWRQYAHPDWAQYHLTHQHHPVPSVGRETPPSGLSPVEAMQAMQAAHTDTEAAIPVANADAASDRDPMETTVLTWPEEEDDLTTDSEAHASDESGLVIRLPEDGTVDTEPSDDSPSGTLTAYLATLPIKPETVLQWQSSRRVSDRWLLATLPAVLAAWPPQKPMIPFVLVSELTKRWNQDKAPSA